MFKRRRDETTPPADAPPPGAPLFPQRPAADPEAAPAAASGLGVPPFRPAVNKEAPPMARPPLNMTPPPNQPGARPLPQAAPPMRPGALPGQPGNVAPQSTGQPPMGSPPAPGGQMPMHAGLQRPQERRVLVIGKGISLNGVIQDAERLVVEGTVEAQLLHATELAIAPGGTFKGEVEVEDSEIAGTMDGAVTARGNLIVRSTGRVLGTARCRRLQVEDGGQISGRIEMITEAAPRTPG